MLRIHLKGLILHKGIYHSVSPSLKKKILLLYVAGFQVSWQWLVLQNVNWNAGWGRCIDICNAVHRCKEYRDALEIDELSEFLSLPWGRCAGWNLYRFLLKTKSSDILRNFLVVFAQHCNHSLHFREVDLWSVMGFLRAFTSSFNLPFDVWNSDYYACYLLKIDLYGLVLCSVLIHK